MQEMSSTRKKTSRVSSTMIKTIPSAMQQLSRPGSFQILLYIQVPQPYPAFQITSLLAGKHIVAEDIITLISAFVSNRHSADLCRTPRILIRVLTIVPKQKMRQKKTMRRKGTDSDLFQPPLPPWIQSSHSPFRLRLI